MFATLIGPYPDIAGASTEGQRLAAVLGDQLEAGLGMLTDGRVYRARTDPGAVVGPWRAADAVGHRLAAERGLEPPLIKACLEGPWTAAAGDPIGRAAPADGPAAAIDGLAVAIDGLAVAMDGLAVAIDALFEAGAPVVQLTELVTGPRHPSDPEAVGRLSGALEELAGRVVGRGHLSLALIGDPPARVLPERLPVGFASYLFDLITSPDDWDACARVPGDGGLIVGVVDARAARGGAMEVGVWGARYAASMGGRGPARTGICPSAGLEHLDRDAARALLAFTAEVARKADLADEELMGELDPKAIDARSAALGRGAPRPRRGPGRPDR